MDTNLLHGQRPEIKIPVAWYEFLLDGLSLALMLSGWIYFLINFFDLPDTIPSHFNSSGNVDGFTSKNILFLMPSLMTFIFLLFTLLTLIPRRYNYAVEITLENAKLQYKMARVFLRTLRLFIQMLLMYILITMVISAKEFESALSLTVVFLFVGMEFVIIGIYIYMSCKYKQSSSE